MMKIRLTIYLSDYNLRQLDLLAGWWGLSRGEAVGRALEEMLAREREHLEEWLRRGGGGNDECE